MQLQSGSDLTVLGNGRIDVKDGGYICIEIDANINLSSVLSVINFHTGHNLGVNTDVLTNPGDCRSSIITIPFTGNGSLNTFDDDVYIQDSTITNSTYITGDNIYIGSDVTTSKSEGPVSIQNNSTLIIDAEGEVFIDGDTQIVLGSEFEILKK